MFIALIILFIVISPLALLGIAADRFGVDTRETNQTSGTASL